MVLSYHLPSLRVGRGEGGCKEGLGESGGDKFTGKKGESVDMFDHLLLSLTSLFFFRICLKLSERRTWWRRRLDIVKEDDHGSMSRPL